MTKLKTTTFTILLSFILITPCFSSSYIYVESYGGDEIMRYDAETGAFVDVFASSEYLITPVGMDLGPDGNLYVVGDGSDNVVRFNGQTGAFMDVFIDHDIPWGNGLTFGNDGNIYISDISEQSIKIFSGSDGTLLRTIEDVGTVPGGIVFAPNGNFFVNANADQILEYTTDGILVRTVSTETTAGIDLKFGPDGNLYVAEFQLYEGTTVAIIDPETGVLIDRLSGGGLFAPTGLLFDSYGNLFVSSFETDEILKYNEQIDSFEYFTSGSGLDSPFHMLLIDTDTGSTIPEPASLILLSISCAVIRIRKKSNLA